MTGCRDPISQDPSATAMGIASTTAVDWHLKVKDEYDVSLPKIIKITFNFLEFGPACKKSVHSIYSFLRYSQFLESRDQSEQTNF